MLENGENVKKICYCSSQSIVFELNLHEIYETINYLTKLKKGKEEMSIQEVLLEMETA